MKFRHFWDALLVVLCIGMTAQLMPHIIAQAQAVARHNWDLLTATWLSDMTGNLLAGILLAASVSSCTWSKVSRARWWLFAAAAALLILGDAAVAIAVYSEIDYLMGDYITFPLFVLVVTLPILAFHTGYIGLTISAWRRRKERARGA